MKNIVLFIIFLLTLFIINIFFYYSSPNYRAFLKSMKHDEVFVGPQQGDGKDTKKSVDTRITNIKEKLVHQKIHTIKNNQDTSESQGESSQEIPQKKEGIQLGQKYKAFINKFARYNLQKLEINTSLFDITTEYPDPYFEYYSRELTLYVFPTKSYDQVKDIFTVLQGEIPFTINVTNNFGDATFYINLNKNIDDGIVRMVVSYQNMVFGLKIKKNQYNNVKKILSTL